MLGDLLLDGEFLGVVEREDGSVVDNDVDSSENFDDLIDTALEKFGVTNVALERKASATSLSDLFSSGVDGSGELLMLSIGLGEDDNVSTVLGGSDTDSLSDSSGGTGNDKGLTLQTTNTFLKVHVLRSQL